MSSEKFNFIDYLAAKKSVDDRALNRQVWQSLIDAWPGVDAEPVQVLEVATGIGTMLERLAEQQVLSNVVYTAIDLQPAYIAEANRRLPLWAEKQGFQVRRDTDETLIFERSEQQIKVILEAVDIFDFIARAEYRQRWDVLIAHAFLDLVDISTLLPALFSMLKPAGLYYFSINFDGETILLPQIDPVIDREIIDLYHRVMDQQLVNGKRVGGSQTGRQLFSHLKSAGVELINVGSSDWVVFAGQDGYLDDEAHFLHCIIDTIQMTLQNQTAVDIQPWIAHRHAQIDQNELVYIAHQLDFLGRV